MAILLSDPRNRVILALFLVIALVFYVVLTLFMAHHSAILPSVGLATIAVTGVVGLDSSWAPWRLLFRWFPALQDRFLPDLNGVWVGVTESNWDRIQLLSQGQDPQQATLRSTRMKLRIRHSFLSFVLEGRTEGVDGESRSIVGTIHRDQAGRWQVSYVYDQAIPDPEATDENSHVGAAQLKFHSEAPDRLSGHYWTRRMWHVGKNTAGRIELRRVSRDAKAFNPHSSAPVDYDSA